MSFEGIIGNEKIKKNLEDAIRTETFSHSYLFIGPVGVGKKKFAIQFAKMILCTSEQNQKPCEKCSSCIKFDGGNNPDFRTVQPDGNSIKIAQIREIQEKIYEKPIASNKKVFIIDDSDKMTEEAQNSLLKTLEEPPEYAVIILIAANESKMLNTIKSRCLKVSFTGITQAQMLEYISTNKVINNPSENILSLCNGSIGKLEDVLENITYYEELENVVQRLMSGNIKNIVQMFNSFQILYSSKELIFELLDYMIVIIYNYMRKTGIYKQGYLNIVPIIEKTKIRLNSNTNFDMCIDELLMNIFDNIR